MLIIQEEAVGEAMPIISATGRVWAEWPLECRLVLLQGPLRLTCSRAILASPIASVPVAFIYLFCQLAPRTKTSFFCSCMGCSPSHTCNYCLCARAKFNWLIKEILQALFATAGSSTLLTWQSSSFGIYNFSFFCSFNLQEENKAHSFLHGDSVVLREWREWLIFKWLAIAVTWMWVKDREDFIKCACRRPMSDSCSRKDHMALLC